jgi:PAS domain S-box-containing protein
MQSETQYRQLVNVAQEGIWVLDCNYNTVFVNPQMVKLLGYAESEVVGKNLFDFLDQKCIEQSKQFLGKFKQGAKGRFDCELKRKDKSRLYVSIAASLIKDDEGNQSGTLMMVSDITERRILERKVNDYSKHLKYMVDLRTTQLKDANERLIKSERLAAIGELAGMVGHDLRNPLAGIKNATYYLKKKGATISETQNKEMLEIIDKAIDHSDKIINDLLEYSREMHLELTESTLPTLLDAALRMIHVPDRIQLLNNVSEEIAIRVDVDKIMRILLNLIKNAIDAMPEKGTLEISSSHTGDFIKIAFADTGTGIPKEVLPKIFVPLFTTKAQGMGFGLAICKRIVEAHEGTIKVKTKVNNGTIFTITLPTKSKVSI